MLTSSRSLWRVVVLALVAAAFVLVSAPEASAAKKKKPAKPAATGKATAKPDAAKPAKPDATKPAEPVKPAEVAKPEPAKPAAAALDVSDLWGSKCKSCHGPDGKGKPPKTEDMTTPAWQKRFTDAQIRKTITDGFERDKDGTPQKMKAFKDFTPAQLDGLVAHVRSLGK